MSEGETAILAPRFIRGDQTSMVLGVLGEAHSGSTAYTLQAKIVPVTWDKVDMVKEATPTLNEESSTNEWHINDLEPGTAYMVRFVTKSSSDGTVTSVGKETVFDTKPIGCAGDDSKNGGCTCVIN